MPESRVLGRLKILYGIVLILPIAEGSRHVLAHDTGQSSRALLLLLHAGVSVRQSNLVGYTRHVPNPSFIGLSDELGNSCQVTSSRAQIHGGLPSPAQGTGSRLPGLSHHTGHGLRP